MLCLILWMVAAPPAAAEQSLHSLDEIRAGAKAYLLAQLQQNVVGAEADVEVNRLDPRLRLPHCGDALHFFLPSGDRLAKRMSIGVRCNGDRTWQVYVSATTHLFQDVVVSRGHRKRGDVIASSDITLKRMEISQQYRGYYMDPAQVLGKRLTRAVAPGQTLTPAMLVEPLLVERGDAVTLLASTKGIEVRAQGLALMPGTEGARIKVKNLKTHRVVEGEIVSKGLINISLGPRP